MNAVSKVEPKEVATTNETSLVAMAATLERLAMNPDFDVEKLNRILDAQERILSKQAETDFNIAMNAAQSEIGRVATDKRNEQTHSDYASYAALDRVVRPVYTRHGFALSFDTGEGAPPEHVRVLCYVSHRGGYSRTYRTDMPADGKGPKGGDVMSRTHAAGSAHRYGMRYLLNLIFNIAIGEDDDGNGAGFSEKISADQATVINDLIAEIKLPDARKKAFLKWAKAESVEDMPTAVYADAVRYLKDLQTA